MNISNNSLQKGKYKRSFRWFSVTLGLGIGVLVFGVTHLMMGNTWYQPDIVFRVLSGEAIPGASFAVRTLRFPRMVAGILGGFAFGIGGNTFQILLRNPLASPDILGISTSSSAAAVFAILVLRVSQSLVSLFALLVGLSSAFIIYKLSRGTKFSPGRLILVGIGMNAMASALISYLLVVSSQYEVSAALRWMNGSLNGIQLPGILHLFWVVMIGSPLLVLFGRQLQMLELGDDSAQSLGVSPDFFRVALILLSVILLSFATAATGPIGFVAFLSGPIARLLAGKAHGSGIPAGFTGALLVLLADLVGQFALGTRYPVGVITGIVGAPYLLALLIMKYRSGEME